MRHYTHGCNTAQAREILTTGTMGWAFFRRDTAFMLLTAFEVASWKAALR